DGQPVPASLENHLVALVGLLRVAEAGELPDRPFLAAVAGRVETASERVLPRPSDAVEARVRGAVRRSVNRFELDAGQRREVGGADLRVLEARLPASPARVYLLGVHGPTLLGRPTSLRSPPRRRAERGAGRRGNRALWRHTSRARSRPPSGRRWLA